MSVCYPQTEAHMNRSVTLVFTHTLFVELLSYTINDGFGVGTE